MSDQDLLDAVPTLLPLAVEWAERESAAIARGGRGLTPAEGRLAAAVRVDDATRVRLLVVGRIPAPDHPLLAEACARLGFLGPGTVGLTLGHGIYLQRDAFALSRRLLPHELRHVAQYEAHGGIAAYLAVYIPELLRYGYDAAPLSWTRGRRRGSPVGPFIFHRSTTVQRRLFSTNVAGIGPACVAGPAPERKWRLMPHGL